MADLWKPEFAGKVQLLDDVEVFNIALLKIGQDPNTQDPKIIEQAHQELLKLRPNVRHYLILTILRIPLFPGKLILVNYGTDQCVLRKKKKPLST